MQQRLQKAIAAAGIASRRHAEELIAAGKVRVDGKVIREMGVLVDPKTQNITVDGKPLESGGEKRYIALHKPVGYVSTLSDPYVDKKVTDLVPIPGVRLVPAGRLDADSEGLILLSNDGDFVYKVTHPSQSLGKTYLATVEGVPVKQTVQKLAKGLMLEGEERPTAPAGAKYLGPGPEPNTSIVELTLHEGRNRQVRRMLDRVGHPVLRLIRVRVGPVALGDLAPGAWRDLTRAEITRIRQGGKAANNTAVPDKSGTAEKPRPGRPGAKPIYRKPIEEPGGSTAKHRTEIQRKPSPRTPPPGARVERDRAQGPKGEVQNETGNRGRSRPGPGQDNRKPAPKRVQIHQDRVNGRVPSRGEHNPPHRRGGKGPGALPDDNRGSQQDT